MTLEQIVNTIRTFANAHLQIKSFFEGELSEQNLRQSELYYRFMIELQPSTINVGKEVFSFKVGCFGKVNLNQGNRLNVLSDTRQICTDFISYIKNNPGLTNIGIELPITLNDYVEYSDDAVSGYFFDANISQYQSLNYCGLPIANVPANPYGAANIYDQNGSLVTKLYPGQRYDLVIASGINEGGAAQTYSIQIIDI